MNLDTISAVEATASGASGAGRVSVLHLNAGNLYGGVESMLTTLASLRHLCPGMQPHFANCFEGRSSRELAETGVPVYSLGPVRMSRPWTVWRARRRLRKLLEAQRFDLVICHMDWTLVAFSNVALAAGNRVALWAHAFQDRENWLGRIARRMRPDFVIANSDFTAATIRERFPKTPVQIIYCPVALVDFPDADQWRADQRREQGLDEDTTVILQASRLERWKGHLVLLSALSRLQPKANWVCWIAGGPQSSEQERYFRQMQETANELGIAGRVKLLGQRADVPRLLAAADIFCQPNDAPEPFGLVFVEALWAGRPVISSALGGALEIVDDTCGLLTEPGDPDGLATALERLIEFPELRKQLGRAGAARARELCDPAAQMEKLRSLVQGQTGCRELMKNEGASGASGFSASS